MFVCRDTLDLTTPDFAGMACKRGTNGQWWLDWATVLKHKDYEHCLCGQWGLHRATILKHKDYEHCLCGQ